MKIKFQYLIPLCAMIIVPSGLNAEQKSSSSSVSKSVSVTSSGGKTIKKTVIVRDGVKEVITEITDENGKKTVKKEGGKDAGNNQDDAQEQGPWLGVRVKKISNAMRGQLNLEEDEGVEVDLVARDSPAAKADIRVGDILLSLDGTSVSSPEELDQEVKRHQAGETVKLAYMRGGKRAEVDVTIEERPEKKDDGRNGGADDNKQNKDFDAILNDPNVPENFKKKIREMREKMKDLQNKAEANHINVVTNGKNLDAILNDPNVPESFKKVVREMLRKVGELENKD